MTYHEMPPPLPPEEIPPPLPEEETIKLAPNAPETETSREIIDNQEITNVPKTPTTLPKIDKSLIDADLDPQKLQAHLEQLKALPPDGTIYLYHGTRSGQETALSILNSEAQGVQGSSGPVLSLSPASVFWRNGSIGLRYKFRRDQVRFPGEDNKNADISLDGDLGHILNESKSLPLTQFEAEIMGSEETEGNPEIENQIENKLHNFAEIRADLTSVNKQIETDYKPKIRELLAKSTTLLSAPNTEDFFYKGHPLTGFFGDEKLSFLDIEGKNITNEKDFSQKQKDFLEALDNGLSQIEIALQKLEEKAQPSNDKIANTQDAISKIKDRNPLSWKISLLNKRFFQEMVSTYKEKSPEISDLFSQQNNAKPDELIGQLEKLNTAEKIKLQTINQSISRIQEEKEIYTELKTSIKDIRELANQSIDIMSQKHKGKL